MSNLIEKETFEDLLDQSNSLLSVLAKEAVTTEETSWADLAESAKHGLLSDMYDIGDQFSDTWKDTATNTSYTYPFHLNHISSAELEDGTTIQGAYLQAHWAHPFGVQFSHQRAFLKCPSGLAPGTYYFTIESKWGSNVGAGDVVCFTTTVQIPNGGRVAGCYGAPDQAKSNWRIYTYSADGKTILETITPTFTASGTDLGIQKHNTRNGNLNSTQEMAYGWNRWKTSALRQYLNSDKGVGLWWTAQDEWDIAPDHLTTKAGFLSGCSEEFINAIKPIKVTTYTNTVNDGGGADITYDKVFIPSLEQMFITPQISGEGEFHEYWQRRSGRTTKMAQWQTYPNIITYAVENHSSAQTVRLRSASRYDALITWSVYSSGYVDYYNSSYATRFAPLVFIG